MKIFLSTPSARRATTAPCRPYTVPCHFYPRPPRGGRLRHCHRSGQGGGISIHALREEGDPFGYRRVKLKNDFYPRPPRGGRLYLRKSRSDLEAISIHALREEGDKVSRVPSWTSTISIHALREEGDRMGCERVHRRTDFYPRPPRGGRPKPTRNDMHPTIFLSTPSARRATYAPCIFRPCRRFLSTPSARRATSTAPWWEPLRWDFYPRPPRGGRRTAGRCCGRCYAISIHALREEGDVTSHKKIRGSGISIHALREEGDVGQGISRFTSSISIHALREEGDHFAYKVPRVARRFLSTPSARRATY